MFLQFVDISPRSERRWIRLTTESSRVSPIRSKGSQGSILQPTSFSAPFHYPVPDKAGNAAEPIEHRRPAF